MFPSISKSNSPNAASVAYVRPTFDLLSIESPAKTVSRQDQLASLQIKEPSKKYDINIEVSGPTGAAGTTYNIYDKRKCGTFYYSNGIVSISSLRHFKDEQDCMISFDKMFELIEEKGKELAIKDRLSAITFKITDASSYDIKIMDADRNPTKYTNFKLQILKLFEDEYRDVPSLYEKYGFTSIYITSPYYKILIEILREYVAQFKIKYSECDLYNLSNKLQKLTKKNMLAFCVSTNNEISDNFDKLNECYTKFISEFKSFFHKINKADYIKKIPNKISDPNDIIFRFLNTKIQIDLISIMEIFASLTKTEKLSEQREGGDYFYYYHCY